MLSIPGRCSSGASKRRHQPDLNLRHRLMILYRTGMKPFLIDQENHIGYIDCQLDVRGQRIRASRAVATDTT